MVSELDGHAGVVVVNFQVEIQELVEIKSFHSADRHAHGVTEVVADVVILEKGRILGEDRTLGRILDVGFQRHQALAARLVEEFIHHFEGVEVALFSEFRASEHAHKSGDDLLQNVERIGH